MKAEYVSVEDIAALCGLTTRRIQQMVKESIVPTPKTKGQYDLLSTIKALFNYYEDMAKGTSAKKSADSAREQAADADIREMERGEKLKTLCQRSDYKSNYADAIAQGVSNIQRLSNLTKDQKESVLAAIRSVKLPELKDAE